MTLRQIQIWREGMTRRHAMNDLRLLDIIVVPHVQHEHYERKRERLAFIAEHGYTPEDKPALDEEAPIAALDPEEQRRRNREALGQLKTLTQ